MATHTLNKTRQIARGKSTTCARCGDSLEPGAAFSRHDFSADGQLHSEEVCLQCCLQDSRLRRVQRQLQRDNDFIVAGLWLGGLTLGAGVIAWLLGI